MEVCVTYDQLTGISSHAREDPEKPGADAAVLELEFDNINVAIEIPQALITKFQMEVGNTLQQLPTKVRELRND